MPHILIVDSDEEVLRFLDQNLSKEGLKTTTAPHAEAALTIIRREQPDLVLMEATLPKMSGLDLTRFLKSSPSSKSIPVVIFSTNGGDADVVSAFDAGASDYITKPFSLRVLLARLRTVLRRGKTPATKNLDKVIKLNGVTIWPERYSLMVEGKPVALTHTEFRILVLLANQYEKYFTRSQIIDAVSGTDYSVTDRSVDVHIFSLRKKLGNYGKMIETIRGVGFRIKQ